MREIIWKLADKTTVFLDSRGFAEMALPGDHAGGLLRYVSRLVMTTGLVDRLWVLAFSLVALVLYLAILSAVPRPRSLRSAIIFHISLLLLSFSLLLFPFYSLGASVWVVYEPSFAIFNALGLAAAFALFAIARKFPKLALFYPLLFVPLGIYPLLTLAALAIARVPKLCRRAVVRHPAYVVHHASYIAHHVFFAVFTFALASTAVYRGRSTMYLLLDSNGFRFAVDRTPVATQLAMERAVRGGDWKGVMALAAKARADAKHDTLRMEIAYRILAQYWLGTVADELFAYPIPTCHNSNDAQELLMDGYYVFYRYGFLQVAQREIYEQASTKGFEPNHFATLGDIALVLGEKALAYNHYREFARIPFRGAEAAERLAILRGERKSGPVYAEFSRLAEMNRVWRLWAESRGLPFFSTDPDSIETFIYDAYHNLKNATEPMVKMFIASAILNNDGKILTENFNLLDHFWPAPRPWSPPVQVMVLDYLNSLKGAEQRELAARIRPGAIESRIAQNLQTTATYRYAHGTFVPYTRPDNRR